MLGNSVLLIAGMSSQAQKTKKILCCNDECTQYISGHSASQKEATFRICTAQACKRWRNLQHQRARRVKQKRIAEVTETLLAQAQTRVSVQATELAAAAANSAALLAKRAALPRQTVWIRAQARVFTWKLKVLAPCKRGTLRGVPLRREHQFPCKCSSDQSGRNC